MLARFHAGTERPHPDVLLEPNFACRKRALDPRFFSMLKQPMQKPSSRTWRLALSTVTVLVLLALAGTLAANLLMDEKSWITRLEQRATEATGRQVKIAHLKLHLLPLPGIDASQVMVANPAWAQKPQLLQADTIGARIALWPLLRGQVRLVSLSISAAQINAEIHSDGSRSWQLKTAAKAQPAGGTGFDLNQLRSLEVRDTDLHFRGSHAGAAAQLWRIDHLTVALETGMRNLRGDALIHHGVHAFSATAQFDGDAALGQGRIAARVGSTELTLQGRLPLSITPTDAEFKLQLLSPRPNDILEFFDLTSRPLAPIGLRASVAIANGKWAATDLDATLAKLHVTGALQYDPHGPKPAVNAQLSMPRLDWVQTLADAGRPPLPPKLPGELFRTHRLAWRVLSAIKGWQGVVDLHIGALKTRSGIELTNATARLHFTDDRVLIKPMHAGMLGGTAQGSLQLTAPSKTAHLDLQLHQVSLQQWIAALGKNAPLTGGPMELNASVDATGGTMKELGASLTGPVAIRLGPTVITTRGGARAEEILTGLMPIFSSRNTGQINLECAAAKLLFASGRATGSPLVGARSQASQLLTSGFIDLREQTLDLRGRVRARAGLSLGLSTLAGDVKITGLLTHPQPKLDPAGTPGALARLGAAIATGGLSIVATALWDGANPAADACQAAFANHVVRGEKAVK